MKHLFLAVLLCASPVMAHEGNHYNNQRTPATMSAEAYTDDYLNHGYITCYGRQECLARWEIEGMPTNPPRLIVPRESLNYFQYPYNQLVTTW